MNPPPIISKCERGNSGLLSITSLEGLSFLDHDALGHLQSSEFIENLLIDNMVRVHSKDYQHFEEIKLSQDWEHFEETIKLPDAALTAASASVIGAIKADAVTEVHMSVAISKAEGPLTLSPQDCPKLSKLSLKLDRISTGDSKDWAKDFGGQQVDLGPMHPSILDDEDIKLPDAALTAASASAVDAIPIASSLSPQDCPSLSKLSLKLDRISTGDSKIWVKDFGGQQGDLGPMLPSILDRVRVESSTPPLSPESDMYEEYEVPLQPPEQQPSPPIPTLPPLPPAPVVANELLSDLPVSRNTCPTDTRNLKPPTGKKKKKRKDRVLDMTCVAEPTPDDVLFGRGPVVAQHPGNVRFRQKAMEFQLWYKNPSTSRAEKQRIADILVGFVKGPGHRFLEKGKEDKLWHEVIWGEHTKASQAFRDLPKKC